MMFWKPLYLLLITCGLFAVTFAQHSGSEEPEILGLIQGKVIVVSDGDDIQLKTGDGDVYSIHLQGIDAPENKQPFGEESRQALWDLIGRKNVRVVVYKKDSLNRYIGTVYRKGTDVSITQIETGMAWHHKVYSAEQQPEARKRYAEAEAVARAARAGLWSASDPVAPWEYRGEKISAKAVPTAAAVKAEPRKTSESSASPKDSKYLLGPRGGCYYLSASGRKVYVSKSYCAEKQE